MFDQATRLYSMRVLLLALCDEGSGDGATTSGQTNTNGNNSNKKEPLNPRLLTTVRVLLAARAHVTIVFANRNGDEATLGRLRWLGATVVPLNEVCSITFSRKPLSNSFLTSSASVLE